MIKYLTAVLLTATFAIDHLWLLKPVFNLSNSDKLAHLDGSTEYIYWFVWILSTKINIILFVWISTLKYNSLPLNKAAIWAYLIISGYNIIEYIYFGSRNDTYYITEIGYFITVFLLYTKFKNGRASE